MATTLHQDHMKEKTPNFFHTGSLAEYHDYHLRYVLSKYVSKLENVEPNFADNIMDRINNSAFTKAVQCYKHVVTHYMVSKMELWTAPFTGPVYGVDA